MVTIKPLFIDRTDAGKQLAELLKQYRSAETIVLAIPSGGVPVAMQIAGTLNVPLDVVITRKLTISHNPEAGYGAVAEDGTIFLNEPLVSRLGLNRSQIEYQAREVVAEIEHRSVFYRAKLQKLLLAGKTAIIVDDGLASGFTMVAAIKSVQQQKAATIVVASPVASGNAYDLVKPVCDDLVCIKVSHYYPFAVAGYYQYWHDLTEDEIDTYLKAWEGRERK